MADLNDLKKSLETSTAARAKFLSNLLDTLEKSGVDVTDDKVLDSLNLHLDLKNGEAFVNGLNSPNTVIITITS